MLSLLTHKCLSRPQGIYEHPLNILQHLWCTPLLISLWFILWPLLSTFHVSQGLWRLFCSADSHLWWHVWNFCWVLPSPPARWKVVLWISLYFFAYLFGSKVILWNLDRPIALYLFAPVSPALGLQACATAPGCNYADLWLAMMLFNGKNTKGSFHLSSGKLRASLWSLLQENAPNGRGAPSLHVRKLWGLHQRKALCFWRLWWQRIQQPGIPFF